MGGPAGGDPACTKLSLRPEQLGCPPPLRVSTPGGSQPCHGGACVWLSPAPWSCSGGVPALGRSLLRGPAPWGSLLCGPTPWHPKATILHGAAGTCPKPPNLLPASARSWQLDFGVASWVPPAPHPPLTLMQHPCPRELRAPTPPSASPQALHPPWDTHCKCWCGPVTEQGVPAWGGPTVDEAPSSPHSISPRRHVSSSPGASSHAPLARLVLWGRWGPAGGGGILHCTPQGRCSSAN